MRESAWRDWGKPRNKSCQVNSPMELPSATWSCSSSHRQDYWFQTSLWPGGISVHRVRHCLDRRFIVLTSPAYFWSRCCHSPPLPLRNFETGHGISNVPFTVIPSCHVVLHNLWGWQITRPGRNRTYSYWPSSPAVNQPKPEAEHTLRP
jgi:hypothetical protein